MCCRLLTLALSSSEGGDDGKHSSLLFSEDNLGFILGLKTEDGQSPTRFSALRKESQCLTKGIHMAQLNFSSGLVPTLSELLSLRAN